jgi:hypothetical protein
MPIGQADHPEFHATRAGLILAVQHRETQVNDAHQ